MSKGATSRSVVPRSTKTKVARAFPSPKPKRSRSVVVKAQPSLSNWWGANSGYSPRQWAGQARPRASDLSRARSLPRLPDGTVSANFFFDVRIPVGQRAYANFPMPLLRVRVARQSREASGRCPRLLGLGRPWRADTAWPSASVRRLVTLAWAYRRGCRVRPPSPIAVASARRCLEYSGAVIGWCLGSCHFVLQASGVRL